MTDTQKARTVLLPNVELNMESVTVTDVFVKAGDRVALGQALGAVETQKANIEINSTDEGFVHEVFIKVGEEIGEKAPVCSLGDAPPEAESARPASVVAPVLSSAVHPAVKSVEPVGAGVVEKLRASPVARKVARELGVLLVDVPPSGPKGRIMRRDVEAFHSTQSNEVITTLQSATVEQAPQPCGPTGTDWLPFPPSRAGLIAQMETAARTVPVFSLSRQFDLTAISKKEPGITFTHRLVACLGRALEAHRSLLTSIEGSRYRIEEVSVAVAMDTKSGLVAPAVRQPQKLSLAEISATVQLLKARADAGQLKRADFERAPFAISNLGMYGIDQFQPSVFQGQCAVLGVGRAVDAPAGRKVGWFTLICDHRAVDGAEAARFFQTLQEAIFSA